MYRYTIPGIGIDVVDVGRMKLALSRTPGIKRRLFTQAEAVYCEEFRFPERHYAARWAAKEAVVKALGCGMLQWDGVEVVRNPYGAPYVRLLGKIAEFAESVGVTPGQLSISIAHSELSAVSVCMVRG